MVNTFRIEILDANRESNAIKALNGRAVRQTLATLPTLPIDSIDNKFQLTNEI